MFLAVVVALRRGERGGLAIAAVLELIAIASYVASNPALEMRSLAAQFAIATTDAERAITLAAGTAVLESWTGTAFSTGYVLGGIAIVLVSLVMRPGSGFACATRWIGLGFGVLGLVPASAGALGYVLSLASLVPMVAWLALVARDLGRLARSVAPVPRI
jgi:hypothetical protein